MLIIIVALQMDLGLGNLSYLIWVDWFVRGCEPEPASGPRVDGLMTRLPPARIGQNVMQLGVLLLALAQTVIIHRLQHMGEDDLVVICDRVSRIIIPVLIYPLWIIGFVFDGFNSDAGFYTFFVGGTIMSMIGGLLWIRQLYFVAMRKRQAAIVRAAALPVDADEDTYTEVLTDLFHKFDLDGGGSMDFQEMRGLLKQCFKDAPRSAIAKGMRVVHETAGEEEEMELGTFVDAYEAASKTIKAEIEAHKARGASLKRLPSEKPTLDAHKAPQNAITAALRLSAAIKKEPPAPETPVTTEGQPVSDGHVAVDVISPEERREIMSAHKLLGAGMGSKRGSSSPTRREGGEPSRRGSGRTRRSRRASGDDYEGEYKPE